MTEPFTPQTWKTHVAAWWQAAARDLPSTMQRLGVRTAYGLLTASAFRPLLEVYSPDNPGPAIAALSILTAGRESGAEGTALGEQSPFGAGTRFHGRTYFETVADLYQDLRPNN